ncbi:MAG: hypothetical protein EON94_02645 [Caulobacteraceae bacterium]|nr:MAG: hypothetical protein EON94_02645 [Caulobacteraceae bacterium]
MIRTSLAALAACLAFVPSFAFAEGTAEKLTVYKGATLIDGTGAPPRPGMSILVKGERIERVWKEGEIAFKLPPETAVVDVAGQYVLPGLIDSHEHLATPPNRPFAEAPMPRAWATASGRSVCGVIACIQETSPPFAPSEAAWTRASSKNDGPAIRAA